MMDRDFLWCGLNLLLDEEEKLAQLCPACRVEAEASRCPVCGCTTDEAGGGENACFDQGRFERMSRGETQ